MISENYYEVYRLLPAAFTEQLRYRSFRYLTDNHLKVSVENYGVIFREDLFDQKTVKVIRELLETDAPPAFAGQPVGISDVIAVTKSGITSAYYVDPAKLILLPDFFHQPTSGALITIDSENLPLDGRKGSWMTIDTLRIDGRDLFLMQSQDYGRDAPYVVVDEYGRELAADKKGFSDATIEQIRQALKELEAQQSIEVSQPPAKKPKLEVWQQYFENGEYLRAAEITEEQNYNMIDGTMNNRAPKRSVLERLQEKQTKVNRASPPMRSSELLQDSEIERSRK